jgi:hypothetical protein
LGVPREVDESRGIRNWYTKPAKLGNRRGL